MIAIQVQGSGRFRRKVNKLIDLVPLIGTLTKSYQPEYYFLVRPLISNTLLRDLTNVQRYHENQMVRY